MPDCIVPTGIPQSGGIENDGNEIISYVRFVWLKSSERLAGTILTFDQNRLFMYHLCLLSVVLFFWLFFGVAARAIRVSNAPGKSREFHLSELWHLVR